MKKIYLMILILFLIFFLSTCTVNESTGLIVITNLTENDVSNVKVGEVTLTSYISRGAKVDYWYYSLLSGKLTAAGVVKNVYYYNLGDNEGTGSMDVDSLEFEVNHEYKIDIIAKDGKNYFFIHGGVQPGDDYDDDERDNPLD